MFVEIVEFEDNSVAAVVVEGTTVLVVDVAVVVGSKTVDSEAEQLVVASPNNSVAFDIG